MTLAELADRIETEWYEAATPSPPPARRDRSATRQREQLRRLVDLVDRAIKGLGGPMEEEED